MPRDSTGTKARLVAEAERLFAANGVYRVTNREITEAAGQRNVSALNYHFGSRADLLVHILGAHGGPLDRQRGRMGGGLDRASTTRDIIRALVVPYGAELDDVSGRRYLQIVDQLRDRIGRWRSGPAARDVHLQRLLGLLVERPAQVPGRVREHRLIAMMMLMTAVMADRARQLDAGVEPELDADLFLHNLTEMLAGVIEAPCPLPAPPHQTGSPTP